MISQKGVKEMRVKKDIIEINYHETKDFFQKRIKKFNDKSPYSLTMYQDKNPDLVKKRDEKEKGKLLPLLKINHNSKILDIACGIGRWSDAICTDISEYCGIDFCEEFIEIAKDRNCLLNNRFFYVGSTKDIENILLANNKGKYNCILLMGILIYLNDEDIKNTMLQIENVCENHAIICIREPIGANDRLTLKNNFSEELEANYNAIYRTKEELMRYFEKYLLTKGFHLNESSYLFDKDELNNRKETVQYYFIFER